METGAAPPGNPPSAGPVAALPELSAGSPGERPLFDLTALSGLLLRVEVPLGLLEMDLASLLALQVDSILELDRLTGEPLELTVNGTPVARGDARIHGERFALRVTEILKAPRVDELPGAGEEQPLEWKTTP